MGIFSQQQEYFGLDIGSGGIRVVQLKSSGKPVLMTYGHVAVPPKVAQSDAPADIAKVAAIVRQLIKDARISTKNVIAGVPSSKVFATVITTPRLSHDDLAKAIKLQADQYIPINIKDVKLDFVVLGPGKTNEEQEVLIVAAPNTVTEKYLSICEQAGLDLIALEPNAIALSRAAVQANDLAVLVLDIGSIATDISIVHANMPKLLRSINVGGTTFIRAVAQNLGLDDAQADQFTKKFGLTQTKLEGQVLKAIKPSMDQLTAEISRSINFFVNQYPQVKLEKLVLCGGTTSLPELPTYLSTATGLPVEIGNAWAKVQYPSQLQNQLMGIATEFGVATGLAERDLLE